MERGQERMTIEETRVLLYVYVNMYLTRTSSVFLQICDRRTGVKRVLWKIPTGEMRV